MSARQLVLDIETSPAIVHTWGLRNVTIGLSQVMEPTRMLCFAAKWRGERKVMFWSEFHDGRDVMLQAAYDLLDEADAVIHYNGTSFDMPHLHRELLLARLGRPSPSVNIDLYRVVRKNFRFLSNKLQHVTTQLGLEGKVAHEGHSLWVRCMEGDEAAWAKMRRYNKGDVVQTELLADELTAWMPAGLNLALFNRTDGDICPKPGCGQPTLIKRGFALTPLTKFQRYQCTSCGGWCRDNRALDRVTMRSLA